MKILVTGGLGYIGSVLVPRLLDEGHEVLVVDNMVHGIPSLIAFVHNRRLSFVKGDVRDERVMKTAISRVDVIIPLAAIVGAPYCDRDPVTSQTTNLDAIHLLNALRSSSQIVVYPTTNSGYGAKSGDVYCTEDTPLEPISIYGKTKVQAERALLDHGEVITLRLATVFGVSPRMRLDLLVNHFTFEALTKGYLVIFQKDFKRNYVHIRDVANCFVFCINNFHKMKNQPYNCGLDDANYSKQELVELIQMQIPKLFVHFAEIGEDPDKRNYIVSNQKLRDAGYTAKISVEEGISEIIRACNMLPMGQWVNY